MCLYHWQLSGWISLILRLHSKSAPNLYHPIYLCFLAAAELFTAAMEIYANVYDSDSLKFDALIARHIFYALGFWNIYLYFTSVYRDHKELIRRCAFGEWIRSMNHNEYSTFTVLIAGNALFFGVLVMPFIVSGGMLRVEDYSIEYLIGYFLCMIAFLCIIEVLPMRSAKFKSRVLEANLELKRTFVRYVGHEIRTPLNIVCMGLELLGDELKTDVSNSSHAKSTVELRESCKSAVEILDNLLNYEKLDTGVMVLERKELYACRLFRKKVKPFLLQARAKNINLVIACESDSQELDKWWINADDSKLGQVMSNLVSNAIKFTPELGEIIVGLSVVKRAEQSFFRVEVKDTGHGISLENQTKVFRDIVQFHANTHQKGGGSGLGLWISKKIVELHEGSVGVISRGEGFGCTFFMEVPAFATPLSLGCTGETTEPVPVRQSSSLPKLVEDVPLRVLVVDDSQLNRKMLQRMLEKMGHTCDQADDGETAVRMYTESAGGAAPYEVIIMDHFMPRMNGSEASAEIRRLGFTGVILGLTGNALPEDIASFKSFGVDDVLVKPTESGLIRAAIEKFRTQATIMPL